MTIHQSNQGTNAQQPNINQREEELRVMNRKLSAPGAQVLDQAMQTLNTNAMQAAQVNTGRLALEDAQFFGTLEDQLFVHYAEFPRDALAQGLCTALRPLVSALVGTAVPDTTPLDTLLRMYVFHQAPRSHPSIFLRRMLFVREYLLQNVTCLHIQKGFEEEARRSALMYHLQRLSKARTGANFAHDHNVLSKEFGGDGNSIPFILDAPIFVEQVQDTPVETYTIGTDEQGNTAPIKQQRTYNISEYQFNDQAMEQLSIRQFVDVLANKHQEILGSLGLGAEFFADPLGSLPADIRQVTLPEEPGAAEKNAQLGLSPEKIAYAIEVLRAARAFEAYMRDPAHGTERQEFLTHLRAMRQAKGMLDAGEFAAVDPQLATDVQSILDGTDTHRTQALRRRLTELKTKLGHLVVNTTTYTSPLDATLLQPLMSYATGIDVPHRAMQNRIRTVYDDNLQKLPRLLAATGPQQELVQALETLRTLDVETADLPGDFPLDLFEKVKIFAEEVAVRQEDILEALNDSMQALRTHRAELQSTIRSEVLQGGFEVEAAKALEIFRDIQGRAPATPKYTWKDGRDLEKTGIFISKPWEIHADEADRILSHLTLFTQEYTFLKEAYRHLGGSADAQDMLKIPTFTQENIPFTGMVTKDALIPLEGAAEDYAQTAAPTGYWQKAALRTRIEAAIAQLQQGSGTDQTAAEANQTKIDALQTLLQRLDQGHFTLEDVEVLASHTDPALTLTTDLADQLRLLVRSGILATAQERALLELRHAKTLSAAEQKALDDEDRETHRDHFVQERMEEGPREEVQEFLERLSNGTLHFTSVEDAQKQLNEMYAKVAARNNLPPIEHRLGRDAWYEMDVTAQIPDPKDPTKSTEEKHKMLLAINSASMAGIRFAGSRQRMSLEQFVYHVVHGVFNKNAKARMTWKHDNQKDPVRTLKELNKKNIAVNEKNLSEGSLLQNGKEYLGKVLRHGSLGKGPFAQQGVYLQGEATKDPKTGKTKRGKTNFISYTELYIHRDTISAQTHDADSIRGGAREGGHPRMSLMTMFHVGKGIFTHKKEEVEKWDKMRKTLEALYFYKHDGKNVWDNASLWSNQQNEMERMEGEISKGYRSKLENLQSDQMEAKILEEMERFEHIDLNQVSSGNKFTDLMGEEPIFVKRAEFKALLLFVLENYGNLYPFESLANKRGERFWLKKIKGSAVENERGYNFAIKNKGNADGLAEIYQISGIARARINLYGDTYAKQVEDAYSKGQGVAKSKKIAELDLKQTGGQIKAQLIQELKDRNWAGIQVTFNKLVQKEVNQEELFNMFLFLYIEITKYGNKHGLPPHIPYEELKDIAGAVFPGSPELYFFLLKGEENVRMLERFLTKVDPDFYNYEMKEEGGKFKMYRQDGKPSEIHKAFLLDGDYQLLENYHEATTSTVDGAINMNYISCLQKTNINPPTLHLSDHDAKMWSRSPLLYTNEYVLQNMITSHITGSGLDNGHSRNYMDALIASLDNMQKNTPPHLRKDMEAFLNRMRRIFYDKVYVGFSFKDTLESNSAYGNRKSGIITDVPTEKSERRNGFMKAYYDRLRAVGLSVQDCARAAGQDRVFAEHTDPKYGKAFKDRRKGYLVWEVTNYENNNVTIDQEPTQRQNAPVDEEDFDPMSLFAA